MKEEIKGDAELQQIFSAATAAEIVPALQASDRGQRFIDERIVPVSDGVRLARGLEPRVHLPLLP